MFLKAVPDQDVTNPFDFPPFYCVYSFDVTFHKTQTPYICIYQIWVRTDTLNVTYVSSMSCGVDCSVVW